MKLHNREARNRMNIQKLFGFLVCWFRSFLVSWCLCVLAHWFVGFLVSWFQSFQVSKFQSFQDSKIVWYVLEAIDSILPNSHSMFSGRYWSDAQDFPKISNGSSGCLRVPSFPKFASIPISCLLEDIDLIFKIFEKILHGSSDLIGFPSFPTFPIVWCPIWISKTNIKMIWVCS